MTDNSILDKIKELCSYSQIEKVVNKLSENHQIYLTGGCVRDILIGRKVKDVDFATSAKPETVENLFEDTLDIGKKFGTITVVLDEFKFEVTTFRKDFNYDGRHPSGVEFGDLKTDAIRRDFTINALYFDLKNNKLIDYVGGLSDINSKTIRTVKKPLDRFKEDKLRMLRAVRFASELGWKIEKQTYNAIKSLSQDIDIIKKERWFNEFYKIIISPNPLKGLKLLLDTDLLQNYLSHDLEEFFEQVNKLKSLYGGLEARLGALLYTSSDDIKEKFYIGKNYKKRIDAICAILQKDIMSLELWELRQINENLYVSDALLSENRVKELGRLKQVEEEYPNIPKPLVTGDDVKTLIKKESIGTVLDKVRKMQLNEKIKTRSEALDFIQSLA